MMGAGTLGVSRRHWDMGFTDAALTFKYPAAAYLMMGLNGLSAILASLGGALYVLIAVGTILWGKPVTAANVVESLGPMPKRAASAVVAKHGDAGTWHLPGTYILVTIFFVAFVLYYFVNWKYLSQLWLMG
jgi:cytochrome c oxidase subunit 1